MMKQKKFKTEKHSHEKIEKSLKVDNGGKIGKNMNL